MILLPNISCIFLSCLTGTLLDAQIISSLSSEDKGKSSIISVVTDNNDSSGVFLDWSTTLGEFNSDYVITKKEVQQEVEKAAGQTRSVTFKGITYSLPTAVNEDGMDMYMLTDEGITIYMAMLEPVFYQDTNPDIIKWIRYYAYTKRKYTSSMFKRYAKWEAFFKETFNKQGVPEEITELCLVESGCTTNALSPVGAMGMWQIMPETGKGWGMIINDYIDERKDPIVSTKTAAKILAQNYKITNDWTLAIAAYNCGAGLTLKYIKQTGYKKWEEIYYLFPRETQQYLPSLLALHYVWNYRTELGFR